MRTKNREYLLHKFEMKKKLKNNVVSASTSHLFSKIVPVQVFVEPEDSDFDSSSEGNKFSFLKTVAIADPIEPETNPDALHQIYRGEPSNPFLAQ